MPLLNEISITGSNNVNKNTNVIGRSVIDVQGHLKGMWWVFTESCCPEVKIQPLCGDLCNGQSYKTALELGSCRTSAGYTTLVPPAVPVGARGAV